MPSVRKIHNILELLRKHYRTGLTNREISRTLDIPPSTCYRILADLKKYDYVTQRKNDLRYMLGFAHMRYAESLREGMDVVALSAPYLESLHRETDETTFLAMFNRSSCVTMEVYGNINTRISVGRGEILPLHASAAGKAVFASMPDRERRALLTRVTRDRYTEHTITDRGTLEKHLRAIRDRGGVAFNFQEFHKAINALASPIFGHDGHVLGALALVGFSVDLDREQMEEFAHPFLEASRELSRKMGGGFPRDNLRQVLADGSESRKDVI
jgi:DNA-binding IclR family transcriptional regulator